jgi:hypothetical protein
MIPPEVFYEDFDETDGVDVSEESDVVRHRLDDVVEPAGQDLFCHAEREPLRGRGGYVRRHRIGVRVDKDVGHYWTVSVVEGFLDAGLNGKSVPSINKTSA